MAQRMDIAASSLLFSEAQVCRVTKRRRDNAQRRRLRGPCHIDDADARKRKNGGEIRNCI
jgi:hypothetical protein